MLDISIRVLQNQKERPGTWIMDHRNTHIHRPYVTWMGTGVGERTRSSTDVITNKIFTLPVAMVTGTEKHC